jgi:hypothetical protein
MNSIENILLTWSSSFVIVETITNLFLWATSKGKSGTINEYYHKMPVPIVVIGDFTYSTLIFLTALAIFKAHKGVYPLVQDWMLFTIIFIITQWIYDITWALSVKTIIKTTKTKNKYLDFFNRYANELGFQAAFGDSLYGLAWLSLFFFMQTHVDDLWKYFLIFLGVFITTILSF